MVNDIGEIIIAKLGDLPFVDKIAGIVRTITYKETGANGQAIIKRMPVQCNVSLDQCLKNKRYLDLLPDSKKTSVIFLEDNGTRLIEQNGNYSTWESSIDLITWLNLPKIGFDGCSYSAVAVMGILSKIPSVPFNALDKYQYVKIKAVGERPKSYNPYQKYSIDETTMQYLLYPFDYFTLQLAIQWRMDIRCFNAEALQPEINCVKK